MDYQTWLSKTFEDYNSFDDWHTNEEILNMLESDRPEDWVNPFDITEEEIDKLRETFKGGFKKWQLYVEENLPQLDPKKEGKLKREANKNRDIRLCGTVSRVSINPITKKIERKIWNCKRRDCPKCKAWKQQEIFNRMEKMVGKQSVIVDNEIEAEKIINEATDYFRKRLDDGRVLLILETDKEIGQEFTYSMAKEYATIAPQGSNISGNLGKDIPTIVSNEETLDFDEKVDVNCKEYLLDATEKEINEIEAEYQIETADIQATALGDIQATVYRCEDILESIAEKKGIGIFFLYRTKITIKESDFLKQVAIKVAKL